MLGFIGIWSNSEGLQNIAQPFAVQNTTVELKCIHLNRGNLKRLFSEFETQFICHTNLQTLVCKPQ